MHMQASFSHSKQITIRLTVGLAYTGMGIPMRALSPAHHQVSWITIRLTRGTCRPQSHSNRITIRLTVGLAHTGKGIPMRAVSEKRSDDFLLHSAKSVGSPFGSPEAHAGLEATPLGSPFGSQWCLYTLDHHSAYHMHMQASFSHSKQITIRLTVGLAYTGK